jgi:hypothetical protein
MRDHLKPAMRLLEDVVLHVRPPAGCAITVTERPTSGPDDPNWVAASGIMSAEQTSQFSEKVAELRKSDLLIDWDGVRLRNGENRRIALWLSEVEPRK